MSTEQNTEEIERRIGELVADADRMLNYDAEVLEDQDNPAAADRVRAEAQDSLREADRLSREAGLGSIFGNDEDEWSER